MTTRRQLAVVLLSAVLVGASLGGWLTVAFVRENLGGDFIGLETGELHLGSISFLFLSLSAILAAPLAIVFSLAGLALRAVRRRRKVA
jgi:hypothetical protein